LIQSRREREICEKQRWRFYHNTMKDKSTSIFLKGIRIAFFLCVGKEACSSGIYKRPTL